MKNEILPDLSRERLPRGSRLMNWSIRARSLLKWAGNSKWKERRDLRKFIHRGRSKLTEEQRDEKYREREEGIGRETVDGLAALYLRETGHRDPTVFTGSIHIRGEGEKLARRSSSPASIPPAPVSFLCASGPIRLFLVEYPTKWGQVLRRICGIDGTHLSGRMVYPRADRGSYE